MRTNNKNISINWVEIISYSHIINGIEQFTGFTGVFFSFVKSVAYFQTAYTIIRFTWFPVPERIPEFYINIILKNRVPTYIRSVSSSNAWVCSFSKKKIQKVKISHPPPLNEYCRSRNKGLDWKRELICTRTRSPCSNEWKICVHVYQIHVTFVIRVYVLFTYLRIFVYAISHCSASINRRRPPLHTASVKRLSIAIIIVYNYCIVKIKINVLDFG